MTARAVDVRVLIVDDDEDDVFLAQTMLHAIESP